MKNILNISIGQDAIAQLSNKVKNLNGFKVFLIDHFFENNDILKQLPVASDDFVHYVNSKDELTTDYVDKIVNKLKSIYKDNPSVIIGIGGGTSLDFAKAVANLLNNSGNAEDYQGWDLVKHKAVYKIGIPTLSGTGAEASRTCVMINTKNGLKLGMNSDFTIYDELILDHSLTKTVPRKQYFYTGMDTFIHCIESLKGNHRHVFSDAFSEKALQLSHDVFSSDDMMSDENREKIMMASYFGGVAIANSFVGVIHPFSAGLSVVLGIHHCEANCITMRAMEEFYPEDYKEFWKMVDNQNIEIRENVCSNLTNEQYDKLYQSTVIHEVPLKNALGDNFKEFLTKEKVIEIFKKM